MIVISAGSSVGARDETAEAVAPPRRAGHLVPRPGHQARQAHPARRVRRRAGDRAAGEPAFRARGLPAGRDAAGAARRRLHHAAAEPAVRARLGARPGIRGRAARRGPGPGARRRRATPLFGLSALLSVLTAADGYVIVPEEATGLDAGTEVDVTLVSLATVMADSPFIRDVPAARALDAWRSARDAAGCPARLPAVPGAGSRTPRAGSPPSRCGPPAPRRRSTRRAWTGSRSGPPTPSARARPRRSTWSRAPTTWWTPATRCPTAGTRW